MLDDEIFQFAVGQSDDGGDHVVVAVGSAECREGYMFSPRYSRAVG